MTWKVIKKRIGETADKEKCEIWKLQNGPEKRAIVVKKVGSSLYYIIETSGNLTADKERRILRAIEQYEERKAREKKIKERLFKERNAIIGSGNKIFSTRVRELLRPDKKGGSE